MLEILLLISLCRKIGERAAKKGLAAGLYKFLVVVAWFGGEFAGFIFAFLFCEMTGRRGDDYMLLGYAAAIFTAAISVWFIFKIVAVKPELHAYDDDDESFERA